MNDYVEQLGMLPVDMQGGVLRYIERGIPPGGFLTAVVSNDLFNAFGRADDENQRAMFQYVKFFYNYAPSGCHGSPEKVKSWIECGGLEGMNAAEEVKV